MVPSTSQKPVLSESPVQLLLPKPATSQKILVVDDEEDVCELVSYHLRARGYDVKVLPEANHLLAEAAEFLPDLVILDVMMPGLNGLQACRQLRADARFQTVPVIFLSARGESQDRIQGLETGADDYLGKPFSPKELVLRVATVLRRGIKVSPEASPPALLRAGRIVLDPGQHTLEVDGQRVDMTATEFKLLRLLLENQGRVQSREQLLHKVWKYEAEIETRTVDTHIRRLREKLGSEAELIQTVRGVGYRLRPD